MGPVIVIFDADIITNTNVHQAAKHLAEELVVRGATSVKFVKLPDSGNAGLDDVLASRRGPSRTGPVLAGLIKTAGNLPPAPRGPEGRFFGTQGLRVVRLIKELRERLHLAVDPGDRLYVYFEGRYVDGRHQLTAVLGELLVDMYRQMHERSVTELLVCQLATEGRIISSDLTPCC